MIELEQGEWFGMSIASAVRDGEVWFSPLDVIRHFGLNMSAAKRRMSAGAFWRPWITNAESGDSAMQVYMLPAARMKLWVLTLHLEPMDYLTLPRVVDIQRQVAETLGDDVPSAPTESRSKLGVPHRAVTKEDVDRIIVLYERDRLGVRRIAREMGRSMSTIYYVLKSNGVVFSPGRPRKPWGTKGG